MKVVDRECHYQVMRADTKQGWLAIFSFIYRLKPCVDDGDNPYGAGRTVVFTGIVEVEQMEVTPEVMEATNPAVSEFNMRTMGPLTEEPGELYLVNQLSKVCKVAHLSGNILALVPVDLTPQDLINEPPK